MVWQPNILNNCYELSGGYAPRTTHQGLCPWTPLGDFRSPDPLPTVVIYLLVRLYAARRTGSRRWRWRYSRVTRRSSVSCWSTTGARFKSRAAEMLQSRDQSGLDTRVLISISVLASMPERSQRHSVGQNFGHGLAGLVSFNVTGE